MKVRELIEQLKKFDGDMEVRIPDDYYCENITQPVYECVEREISKDEIDSVENIGKRAVFIE